MQVYEARRHVETGGIDHYARLASRDRSFYRRDSIIVDGYIENTVTVVLGVDHMAAFEQNIVILSQAEAWQDK